MKPAVLNRNLVLLFVARFATMLCIQMQSVAVAWQVYDITHNPLSLGLIGLVQFLPMAGFSLVSGQTADRFDRKKIVMAGYFLFALASGALWFLGRTDLLNLPIIYVILVGFGITRMFVNAASQALMPHLVPPEQFTRAVAWNSSVWQFSTLVGPALGGLAYAWAGSAHSVYGICSILALLGGLILSLIHVSIGRSDSEPVTRKTLFAGVRYIWRRPVILGAISLDLFAVLLGGAVALLPIYARDILFVGPIGLGLLRSAPGIGALMTGLVLAFRPIQRKVGARMFACVVGFGLFTIAFGLSKNFIFSLFCLAAMGACDLVSVVFRQSLVQLETPTSMRGRVSAVNFVFIGASNELGEFESGITAAWFGIVPAVVAGGVGTCLVAYLWSRWFPDLRKLDRLHTALEEVSAQNTGAMSKA